MTQRDLYDVYSKWTGELHFWTIKELGRHMDVEFIPDKYQFKVYSGWAEEFNTASGIPGLTRPPGERSETVRLLRPEDNPTKEQLDELFKSICLAAARVLEIDVSRGRLLK